MAGIDLAINQALFMFSKPADCYNQKKHEMNFLPSTPVRIKIINNVQ